MIFTVAILPLLASVAHGADLFTFGGAAFFNRDTRIYNALPYMVKQACQEGFFKDYFPGPLADCTVDFDWVTGDTWCSESIAYDVSLPMFLGVGNSGGRLANGLTDSEPVLAIFGDQCSGGSKSISLAANNFKIPVISGSATAAPLSDKSDHKYFMRTVPPDSVQGRGILRTLNYFNWKRAWFIHLENLIMGTDLWNYMVDYIATDSYKAKYGEIELFLSTHRLTELGGSHTGKAHREANPDNPFLPFSTAEEVDAWAEPLINLRPQPRIFIHQGVHRLKTCGMKKYGLYGADLFTGGDPNAVEIKPVWILTEASCSKSYLRFTEDDYGAWTDAGMMDRCNPDYSHSHGIFCIKPFVYGERYLSQKFQDFIGGLTCQKMRDAGMIEMLSSRSTLKAHSCGVDGDGNELVSSYSHFQTQFYYPLHFDAITAIVWSVQKLVADGQTKSTITGTMLRDTMMASSFEGLSGPVAFDENGDRLGTYQIINAVAVDTSNSARRLNTSNSGRRLNAQFTEKWGDIELNEVGRFEAVNDAITMEESKIQWMHAGLPGVGRTSGDGPTTAPADRSPPCADDEEYVTLLGCQKCALGLYKTADQDQCVKCTAGTYRSEGMEQCNTCPGGHYCPEGSPQPVECGLGQECIMGSKVPTACRAGQFSNVRNASKCENCPIGKYVDEGGQSEAKSCTDVIPDSSTVNNGAYSTAACVCAEGTYLSKKAEGDVGRCVPCLDGLLCPAGLGKPLQAPGVHAGDPPFVGADPGFRIYCANDIKCPGGTALGSCPEKREGFACDVCEVGTTDIDGKCESCDDGFQAGPAIAIIAGGLILCFGIFFVESMPLSPHNQSRMDLVVSFGLTLQALQTLSALALVDVGWIEPMKSVIEALDAFVLSFDALKPGCTFGFNEPWKSYLASILAVAVFVTLLELSFFLANKIGKRETPNSRALNALGGFVMLIFLPICVMATDPMQCVSNPDDSSSLFSRRSIICWDTDHTTIFVLGLFVLLLYVIPFLAICFWATLTYPARIQQAGSMEFLQSFSFLFKKFTPIEYKYGLIMIVRKMLVAFIPVIFANSALLAIFALGLNFVIMMIVQNTNWPWRSNIVNHLDVILQGFLLMVVLGGAALTDAGSQASTKSNLEAIFWFCVITMVVLIVSVAALKIYHFKVRGRSMRPWTVFVINEHKGSAALARWLQVELMSVLPRKSSVFLHCDQDVSLEQSIDIAANCSQHVVALMTKETLSNIVCAAELTAVVYHEVPMSLVLCSDYSPPTEKFIASLRQIWAPGEVALLVFSNLSMSMIQAGYRKLNLLPSVPCKRLAGFSEYESMVECLDLPGVNMVERRKSRDVEADRGENMVAVLADASNSEAMMTAYTLRMMLMPVLNASVTVVGTNPKESCETLRAEIMGCRVLLVLLSEGLLDTVPFAHASVLVQNSELVAVPVSIDQSFAFPEPTKVESIRASCGIAPQNAEKEKGREDAFEGILGRGLLKFFTHARARTLKAQIDLVAFEMSEYMQSPAPVLPKDLPSFSEPAMNPSMTARHVTV